MEQMLRQCVVGHVLSNKQSFISFTATTKKIYDSFVPELANRLSFFHELARVGPGRAAEALDGDPALGVELALVDDVRRLVAAFGDDVLGGEARGGEAELLEGELLEWREVVPVPRRTLPISGVGLELEVVHPIAIGLAAAAAAQQPPRRRPHFQETEAGAGRWSWRIWGSELREGMRSGGQVRWVDDEAASAGSGAG